MHYIKNKKKRGDEMKGNSDSRREEITKYILANETGTVDEKGMKRQTSVIGVITSVIHLPSRSVISCNFAKKKENKKQ